MPGPGTLERTIDGRIIADDENFAVTQEHERESELDLISDGERLAQVDFTCEQSAENLVSTESRNFEARIEDGHMLIAQLNPETGETVWVPAAEALGGTEWNMAPDVLTTGDEYIMPAPEYDQDAKTAYLRAALDPATGRLTVRLELDEPPADGVRTTKFELTDNEYFVVTKNAHNQDVRKRYIDTIEDEDQRTAFEAMVEAGADFYLLHNPQGDTETEISFFRRTFDQATGEIRTELISEPKEKDKKEPEDGAELIEDDDSHHSLDDDNTTTPVTVPIEKPIASAQPSNLNNNAAKPYTTELASSKSFEQAASTAIASNLEIPSPELDIPDVKTYRLNSSIIPSAGPSALQPAPELAATEFTGTELSAITTINVKEPIGKYEAVVTPAQSANNGFESTKTSPTSGPNPERPPSTPVSVDNAQPSPDSPSFYQNSDSRPESGPAANSPIKAPQDAPSAESREIHEAQPAAPIIPKPQPKVNWSGERTSAPPDDPVTSTLRNPTAKIPTAPAEPDEPQGGRVITPDRTASSNARSSIRSENAASLHADENTNLRPGAPPAEAAPLSAEPTTTRSETNSPDAHISIEAPSAPITVEIPEVANIQAEPALPTRAEATAPDLKIAEPAIKKTDPIELPAPEISIADNALAAKKVQLKAETSQGKVVHTEHTPAADKLEENIQTEWQQAFGASPTPAESNFWHEPAVATKPTHAAPRESQATRQSTVNSAETTSSEGAATGHAATVTADDTGLVIQFAAAASTIRRNSTRPTGVTSDRQAA